MGQRPQAFEGAPGGGVRKKLSQTDRNTALLEKLQALWASVSGGLSELVGEGEEDGGAEEEQGEAYDFTPDVEVPCGKRDAYVGRTVPGRHGGKIVGCAMPSAVILKAVREARSAGRKPPRKERQYVIADGRRMRASVARGRIRDATRAKVTKTDAATLAAYAEAWQVGYELPYPIGQEFPHRAGGSDCDPESEVWSGYPGPGDVVAIESHPRFKRWAETAEKCVREFQAREESRRPKASGSSARERAQERERALARGEDVTGAEYQDERKRQGRTVAGRKSRKK